ncbi:MAG: chromosome segregation protein SMC, partial [Thaumarchaeota archaeon]|nr:chromosome segregation protein SMC [Nitrososphaerota archaeon]
MVYVKRLTIQGFKSFGPKRISLELEKGLVVVTGPNGGGKSNVIDAIRFALGELSAHNLRVGRMAELVHDDPSVSWARTAITLDNSDRVLPIDSNEVTISRKITRSGESEYHVNGRQVSRNELLTLLSMANIKPSGFNIVPQGSVVEIAEKSGSELRKMLEEVAGISDYEKKKAEAEEQLAIAEKNLAIAKASTKEVRARVKQLERERNQTFRRKLVEGFLKSIELLKLKKSIDGFEEELREVDGQLIGIESELKTLEERKDALAAERDRLNDLIRKLKEGISRIDERISALDLMRKSSETRISDLRVRISALRERCERLRKEKKYMNESLENLREKLKEIELRRASRLEQLDSLRKEVKAMRSIEEERLRELREAEGSYQALRREVEERVKKFQEKRIELETEIAKTQARRKAIENEAEKIYSEIRKLEKAEENWLHEVFRLRRVIRESEAKRMEIEGRLSELRRLRESYHHRLESVEELEQRLSSALERLASTGILKLEDDSRKLLRAIQETGITGVKGFLKDAILADEKTLKLLESASGGWMRALVVENLSLGIELAKIFGKLGFKLKIIPLNTASNPSRRPKVEGIAYRWKWAERALSHVLKDVEFSSRLKLAADKKIVLDDIILYPDLRIETISLDRSSLSELASREYENARKTLDKLRDMSRELKKQLTKIDGELQLLERERTREEIKIGRLEERLRRCQIQVSETLMSELSKRVELEKLRVELHEIRRKLEKEKEKLEMIPKPKLDEEGLEEAEQKVLEKRRAYEEARLKSSELELKLASVESKIKEEERELQRLRREAEEVEERMIAAEKEYADSLKAIGDTSHVAGALSREIAEAIYGIMKLSELRSEEEKKLEEHLKRIDEIADELNSIGEEERRLADVKSSLQIKRAQLEIQLSNLKEKLSEIEEAPFSLPEADGAKLEGLRQELEEELKELEMINQLAPAQYEELVWNYKLRSSRIAELEAERQEILRFIEWVEGEKRRIFMETFNRVAETFEEYFSKLTGGRGWLRIENPDNPFEGGVEMILAFPGK